MLRYAYHDSISLALDCTPSSSASYSPEVLSSFMALQYQFGEGDLHSFGPSTKDARGLRPPIAGHITFPSYETCRVQPKAFLCEKVVTSRTRQVYDSKRLALCTPANPKSYNRQNALASALHEPWY